MTNEKGSARGSEGWATPPYPCSVCEGEGRVAKNFNLNAQGRPEIVICPCCGGRGHR